MPRKPVHILLGYSVVGLFLYAIIYSTFHAGFGLSKKTFMDWVELLIIPSTLAIAAYLVNSWEKERDSEKTTDQQRENALQNYFEKVYEIIRMNMDLSEDDLASIKFRTLTLLRMLNGERKGFVIKFLFDTGLIARVYLEGSGEVETPLLSLSGADLSGISLKGANFFVREYANVSPTKNIERTAEIDLSGATLRDANLEGANLSRANLSGAILIGANLRGVQASSANFSNSDFTNADLQGIRMGICNLQGAKFINSKCKNAFFWYAKFFDTEYPNDGDPFVNKADFTGADLRFADFNEANLLPEQIKVAKYFWKTRLPNFSLYSNKYFHSLFSVKVGVLAERGMSISSADLTDGICGCKESITVDHQRIIGEKSKEVNRRGEPVSFDANIEVLKALWAEYDRHRLFMYSKNRFTMLFHVLTEYEPGSFVKGMNSLQKKVSAIGQGIEFWKRYKKTKGFTIRENFIMKE